jgi:hypothetical protein
MYFVLRPKVFIQTDKVLNRYDPFQTTFLIINQSELPITNIHYSYIPNVTDIYNNLISDNTIEDTHDDFRENATIQKIPAGKSSTLNRHYIKIGRIQRASIKIKYTYNYIELTFSDSASFYCIRGTNDWYQWILSN